MTIEERNHEDLSHEDLSALMDGELEAEPARFLLRRMERDPEMARTWSRWHLIRASLAQRAQASAHLDPWRLLSASNDDAFVARVMAQVSAQPRRHWARYIGGGAIAASVAAAALMLSVPQTTSTDAHVANAPGRAPALAANRAVASAAPPRVAAASLAASAPWLDHQPSFLAARPANGTLNPDYLQQAAYAPDSGSATLLMRDARQQQFNGAPYMILLVPEHNAAARPRH